MKFRAGLLSEPARSPASWLLSLALICPLSADAQSQRFPEILVEPDVDELVDLIQDYLGWMREVAGWKWRNRLPLQDEERESELLSKFLPQATDLGFETESIERIFRIQFDMSNAIQRYWHRRWQLAGFPPDWQPRNLTEIRPRLTELMQKILLSVYLRVFDLREPSGGLLPNMHRLTELPVDPTLVLQLEQAFKGLSLLPLHEIGLLKRVRASGLLRVGTTGDYPPFSSSEGGRWRGADLQLAELFARALGARVALVPTSWQTLEEDLITGRFDIAMGGISITRERSRLGFFSDPYYQSGKQLLGRCNDRGVLDSIRRIDRIGVRVLVDQGGTEEDYVRQNIKRAEVLVHDGEESIFDFLQNGGADVMVADAVEVQWQSRQRPMLCALSDRLLTRSRMAYLTPRDKEFVGEVNVWLERLRRSGELKRIIDGHLYPDAN